MNHKGIKKALNDISLQVLQFESPLHEDKYVYECSNKGKIARWYTNKKTKSASVSYVFLHELEEVKIVEDLKELIEIMNVSSGLQLTKIKD